MQHLCCSSSSQLQNQRLRMCKFHLRWWMGPCASERADSFQQPALNIMQKGALECRTTAISCGIGICVPMLILKNRNAIPHNWTLIWFWRMTPNKVGGWQQLRGQPYIGAVVFSGQLAPPRILSHSCGMRGAKGINLCAPQGYPGFSLLTASDPSRDTFNNSIAVEGFFRFPLASCNTFDVILWCICAQRGLSQTPEEITEEAKIVEKTS